MGSFVSPGVYPSASTNEEDDYSVEDTCVMNKSSNEHTVEDAFSRWATNGQGTYWPSSITADSVPADLYKVVVIDGIGASLLRLQIKTDELIEFPDSLSKDIVQSIQEFWGMKKDFDKRGFLHKRGILMYGSPGSGKTGTVHFLIKDIVQSGGLAIFAHSDADVMAKLLTSLRKIEPNRPIIIVLEDFESMIERSINEAGWLSILDGELQIDNIVFVATTNYPERLDARFMDRPSRFDVVYSIEAPTAQMRRMFFEEKEGKNNPISPAVLDEWVETSEGFYFSHLREMIIGHCCFHHPMKDVVARLREMQSRTFSSDQHIPNIARKRSGFRG